MEAQERRRSQSIWCRLSRTIGRRPGGPRGLCLLSLSVGALGLVIGCGSLPEEGQTGTVRYIHIRDDVTPPLLFVQAGDEVRWLNLRDQVVKVGFLGKPRILEKLACMKGFSRFGKVDDFVSVAPHEYVALCFARQGTVKFNVWLEPGTRHGKITQTAVIRVEPPS